MEDVRAKLGGLQYVRNVGRTMEKMEGRFDVRWLVQACVVVHLVCAHFTRLIDTH